MLPTHPMFDRLSGLLRLQSTTLVPWLALVEGYRDLGGEGGQGLELLIDCSNS
jgi:hypothetical protein